METQAVLEHHLAVLASGDVEGILQDYTDDSILLTQDGMFKGLAALRGFFSAAVAGPFKPGTYDFTMDLVRVEGEVAYIVWRARCVGANIVLATDTFVVRDGKIVAQTYTTKVEAA
jgi:ketosteroid isomerase-like protein